MSPDTEEIVVNGQSVFLSILKVNILGRNAPAKAVASDYTAISCGPSERRSQRRQRSRWQAEATVRFGPQFDFDVGVNESGANEMRFAYMATDRPATHTSRPASATSISPTADPEGVAFEREPSLRHFHPAIKHGHEPAATGTCGR